MSELVRDGRPLLEGAVRPKEDEVCLDSDGEDEKDVNEAADDGEDPYNITCPSAQDRSITSLGTSGCKCIHECSK